MKGNEKMANKKTQKKRRLQDQKRNELYARVLEQVEGEKEILESEIESEDKVYSRWGK